MKLSVAHLVVGMIQATLGTVMFFSTTWCLTFLFVMTSTSVLTSILTILSGAFGILSYMRQIRGYLVTCIILSVLACITSVESSFVNGVMLSDRRRLRSWQRRACAGSILGLSIIEAFLAVLQALLMCITACPNCCCQRMTPQRSTVEHRHQEDFEPLALLPDHEDS